MIYRNNAFAEENIDPNGHPAQTMYDEWRESVAEVTDLGYKKQQKKQPLKGRKRRLIGGEASASPMQGAATILWKNVIERF